jgi:hypothetical protein
MVKKLDDELLDARQNLQQEVTIEGLNAYDEALSQSWNQSLRGIMRERDLVIFNRKQIHLPSKKAY